MNKNANDSCATLVGVVLTLLFIFHIFKKCSFDTSIKMYNICLFSSIPGNVNLNREFGRLTICSLPTPGYSFLFSKDLTIEATSLGTMGVGIQQGFSLELPSGGHTDRALTVASLEFPAYQRSHNSFFGNT